VEIVLVVVLVLVLDLAVFDYDYEDDDEDDALRVCRRPTMKPLTLLTVLCAALMAPNAPAAETNAPALIIYTVPSMKIRLGTNGLPVVAALWPDGRIVWSQSRTNGGPPYRQGRVVPEKLASLLDTLEREGAFKDPARFRSSVGPDAAYTVIAINDGQRRLRLTSWHELYEQNTNLVVTAAGIGSLHGAKREDLMRDQPEWYLRFRSTWSEIRQAVEALIPKTGEPYEGKIPIPTK
jgi:hypothetical protein